MEAKLTLVGGTAPNLGEKMKIYLQLLTFFIKPQIWLFQIVVITYNNFLVIILINVEHNEVCHNEPLTKFQLKYVSATSNEGITNEIVLFKVFSIVPFSVMPTFRVFSNLL